MPTSTPTATTACHYNLALDAPLISQDGRPTPRQLRDATEAQRTRFYLGCAVKLCSIKNDTCDADVRALLLRPFKITRVVSVRNNGSVIHIIEFWNPKQANEFYERLGGGSRTGAEAIPKKLQYMFRMELQDPSSSSSSTHCHEFVVHRATTGLDPNLPHRCNAKLDERTGEIIEPCRFGFRTGADDVQRYLPVPMKSRSVRPTLEEFSTVPASVVQRYSHACLVTISFLRCDIDDATIRRDILRRCGGTVLRVRASTVSDGDYTGKQLHVEMSTPHEAKSLRQFLRPPTEDVAKLFVTDTKCIVAAGQFHLYHRKESGDAILDRFTNAIRTPCTYGLQEEGAAAAAGGALSYPQQHSTAHPLAAAAVENSSPPPSVSRFSSPPTVTHQKEWMKPTSASAGSLPPPGKGAWGAAAPKAEKPFGQ